MTDAWSVLDALPEAVVGIRDGYITVVNDRAVGLLGIGPDVVGADADAVLDLRDASGTPCQPWTTAPTVGDRVAERIVHVVVGDGRRPLAISGRWRDGQLLLTARSAGRRERLDAVRGDVVATVSHEIRSPLTTVKGFTRTLLTRWDRFSDEQKRTMLATIDADADRVTRLLKELLDVSRIDAGRVQLRRARVDLEVLAERVVDRARLHEDAVDRDLTVAVDGDLPDVLVDVDKVEQVLTNLVENALRYAPGSPVAVELATDDDRLVLTVADHGPGIPPDQRRDVFRKFGRGRDVRRSGTGLGLYISRGLVEAHGGRIDLVDDGEAGARFRVELPFAPVVAVSEVRSD